MWLLKEPAELLGRMLLVGRSEDKQFHAWPVADGEH
jgi:hypothetical protein